MGKKQPIVNHGLLHDSVNYSALIEAQAKMPAFGKASKLVKLVKKKNQK